MESTAESQRPRFRWIETLLAITFVLMIALVAVPTPGGRRMSAQSDAMEITVHRLQRAVRRYIDDHGHGAVEFSGSSYLEPRFHDLSRDNGNPLWHGPYLTPGLTTADNPYGGFVYLYDNLRGGAAAPSNGFRLDGEDAPSITGAGQFVAFGRVPKAAAEELDSRLDDGVGGDWRTEGRVQYQSDPAGVLMIFLCPLDTVNKAR